MPRGEYTGWVRKAKRRNKLNRMIDLYPEDAERYREMQTEITEELRAAGVCLYCGRQLKGDESRARGLGADCYAVLEENGTLAEWLSSLSPAEMPPAHLLPSAPADPPPADEDHRTT